MNGYAWNDSSNKTKRLECPWRLLCRDLNDLKISLIFYMYN